MRVVVNVDCGWPIGAPRPSARCGEVIDLPEDEAREGIERGYLVAEPADPEPRKRKKPSEPDPLD